MGLGELERIRGVEGKVDILYSGLGGILTPFAGYSQHPRHVSATNLVKQPDNFIPYRDKGGVQQRC